MTEDVCICGCPYIDHVRLSNGRGQCRLCGCPKFQEPRKPSWLRSLWERFMA